MAGRRYHRAKKKRLAQPLTISQLSVGQKLGTGALTASKSGGESHGQNCP